MSIKTAYRILKLASIFNLYIKFTQRYIDNIVCVPYIREYRMLFALKGIWLPFAVAQNAISDLFARLKKVFDYRMQHSCIFADFVYFHAVSNPLLHTTKKEFDTF